MGEIFGEEQNRAINSFMQHLDLQRPGDACDPEIFLLFGPPGTGKSLFPGMMEKKYPQVFFKTISGNIYGQYHGESEANVTEVFDECSKHPKSILFIDEADALLRHR